MNGPNKDQVDNSTYCTKPIEVVQATKSGNPGEPLHPTTSVTRRKHLYLIGLIALVSLGAIVVIVFVSRSGLAHSYEGLAAALGVVACGVFLVRRFIRVLAEEDRLQDKQFNANQSTVSLSQPDPAGPQTNLTAPPPEAEKNK